MTPAKKKATKLVGNYGAEALGLAQFELDLASKRNDMTGIEAAMFWREVIVEILPIQPKE